MSNFQMRRLRDAASGPGTLIGKGCKINGTISGTGNFQISGEIEGDCELDGTISITRRGCWKGSIRATAIIVSGTVDGDVLAGGSIEISDTARISGTVTGESIAVAAGAVIEGVMQTTGGSQPIEFTEKRDGIDQ